MVTADIVAFRPRAVNVVVEMMRFLQDELIGLRSRWLRLLALLTCLVLAVVAAEQQRAIEAQSSLIATLSADSNKLQKLQSGDKSEPKVSVYITDSHILEPASKPPESPEAAKPIAPARFQRQI